jgi:hypothetical protein
MNKFMSRGERKHRQENLEGEHSVFVGRRKQIQDFNKLIYRLNPSNRVDPFKGGKLFEYFGPPGIGKTSLISHEMEICRKKGVGFTHIDFSKDPERTEQYSFDPILVIKDMLAALRGQFNSEELDKAILKYRQIAAQDNVFEEGVVKKYYDMDQETKLYKRPEWLEALRSTFEEFIKLVNTQSSEIPQPVVLFFDGDKSLDFQTRDFIEEWIVNPVIQIKHAAVVWTDLRPHRWKRPEIRRNLNSNNLTVFNEKETKKQLELDEYYETIHLLTGGHPGANKAIKEKIGKDGFSPESAREVMFDYIENSVFAGLPEDEKTALTYLAMVRLFDTQMLTEVLKTADPSQFSEKSEDYLYNLFLNLKKSDFLEWDKGYALVRDLRHPIQKYFLEANPTLFSAVNDAAIKVYKDWLNNPVDNRLLFIEELLWHTAMKSLADSPEQKMEERETEIINVLGEQLNIMTKYIKDSEVLKNNFKLLAKRMVSLQNDLFLISPTSFDSGIGKRLAEKVKSFL